MAAFNLGGDWTLSGATTFTGSISATITDFQVEASNSLRIDTTAGGGNVQVGSSNATHVQIGNNATAIDVSCTTFTSSGTGQFSVNAGAIQLSIGGVGVWYADNSQVVAGEAGKSMAERGTTFAGVFSGNYAVTSSAGIMSFDCPVVHISAAGATGITIGNLDPLTAVDINANQMAFFVTSNLDIQCQGATTLCTGAGTSLDIGNATCAVAFVSTTFSLTAHGVVQLIGTSGNMEIGTSGGAGGDLLLSSAVRTFVEGTTVLELVCTGGNINMLVNGVNEITIDGELGAHATVNVATANSDFLNLGNSLAAIVVSGDTFSLNMGGTLHLGGGAATDLQSGLSVQISAPNCGINTGAQTNETHLGNPLVGNVLYFDSRDIQIGNGTTITQTGNVGWGGTGSLNVNVSGVLQLQSSASNIFIGCPGNADIAAPDVGINVTPTARITTIGDVTAGNNLIVNCASITAPNVPTVSGAVSVPAHTPPAGSFYLIVDASGVVSKFSA